MKKKTRDKHTFDASKLASFVRTTAFSESLLSGEEYCTKQNSVMPCTKV